MIEKERCPICKSDRTKTLHDIHPTINGDTVRLRACLDCGVVFMFDWDRESCLEKYIAYDEKEKVR